MACPEGAIDDMIDDGSGGVLKKVRTKARDGERSRAKASKPLGRLGQVLVVEDDPVLAISLEDILREAGAKKIVIAPTTAAAMASLEELRPHVLILDVHLADRDDGWALAELVTQLWPSPPLILFSTATPEAIPDEVAVLGRTLKKPYQPADLLEAIDSASRSGGLLAKLRAAVPLN